MGDWGTEGEISERLINQDDSREGTVDWGFTNAILLFWVVFGMLSKL